jgi:hypothetical protein
MVVPMSATARRRKDLLAMKWGHTVLVATLCQLGWPSTAAMGYATKTSVKRRKTRSA